MSVQERELQEDYIAEANFNTSYVSVQASGVFEIDETLSFQYILCVGSSHLCITVICYPLTFQYILCVGSRVLVFS